MAGFSCRRRAQHFRMNGGVADATPLFTPFFLFYIPQKSSQSCRTAPLSCRAARFRDGSRRRRSQYPADTAGENIYALEVILLHLVGEHIPEKLRVDEHAQPAHRELEGVFHIRQLAHELGVDVVILQIAVERSAAGGLARYLYKRDALKIAEICALGKLRSLSLALVPARAARMGFGTTRSCSLRHNCTALYVSGVLFIVPMTRSTPS